MLGLLVGITIAVLVARSLIRSLRVLRSSALDVAERRLPQAVESMRAGETPDVAVEPVPIGTRDEVGQVARAFDAVHGQAVRLAAEQAALQANVSAMFINLSRRSQALVERQLQLIEALESNEQDADQLSNLFQLDHLATRMRRNSENLLVLAGTDLAKRNMAPVPVVDVLRAAVSEVEQYQRVVVQAPPAASIAGRAGSDVVHLLAELLDNATAFSPPESQVVMSTTRSPDGAIVIEISDRGVGMADDELADANTRLVGPSGVDVSASRRMGLFVVGRLAARHGIGVRLSSTAAGPGSGLTASVSVPPSLIPTGVPADAPRPVRRPDARGRPGAGPSGGGPPDLARCQRRPSRSAVCAGHGGGRARQRAVGRTRGVSHRGPEHPLPGQAAGQRQHHARAAHPRPGSSLRPDGPPPTEAPPGGFFDDGGHGEGRAGARTAAARTAPARPASRPASTRRPPPAATAWPGGRGSPPCRRPTRRATTSGRFPTTSGRRRTKVPPTGRGSPRTSPSPAIARVRAAPHPPAPEVRTPTTTPRGRRRPGSKRSPTGGDPTPASPAPAG